MADHESDSFIINHQGPLLPINGQPDPNRGYVKIVDMNGAPIRDIERGDAPPGLFTAAGIPAEQQLAGQDPFTTNFTDSMEKNKNKKDEVIARKAFAALEDDEMDEFRELSGRLQHGFIVGRGVNGR